MPGYSRQSISVKLAYTLIELLTAILLIAAMITVGLVYVGGYINDSKRISDQKTLITLNEALTRYKCEGGDINALTSGAPIGNVLGKLASTINWNGLQHQVLQRGATYPARSLTAMGQGKHYQFTKYGNYSVDTQLTNGLVGWWKFDEGAGGNVNDSSGCGNNATITGGATWATGKRGNALNFNGIDSYVSIPPNAAFNFANSQTLSFWMKRTGQPFPFSGPFDFSAGNPGNWLVYVWNNGLIIRFYSSLLNRDVYGGNYPISDNTWYHVTYIYDKANSRFYRYVNGSLSSTVNTTVSTFPDLTGSAALQIGRNGASYFQGLIDDVRIYNRALSPTEVLDLYNATQ